MNYKAINTWRGFGDIIINHEKDARLVSNVTRTSRYIYNLIHTPAVLGGNSPLATCSPFPLVPGGVRHVCQEWNRSPCVVQFKDPITNWKYNLKKKKKRETFPLGLLQVPSCPVLLPRMRLARGKQVKYNEVAGVFLNVLSTAASFFHFLLLEKQNNQGPDVLVPGFLKVQADAF